MDLPIEEGTRSRSASSAIDPLFTPGHTDGHHAYRIGERVLTGDALLIDACGRTDFQSGDPAALYHSVAGKLFALPDETLVYPGARLRGTLGLEHRTREDTQPASRRQPLARVVRRADERAGSRLPEIHRLRGARQPGMRRLPARRSRPSQPVLRADRADRAMPEPAGLTRPALLQHRNLHLGPGAHQLQGPGRKVQGPAGRVPQAPRPVCLGYTPHIDRTDLRTARCEVM
jgi:hypothetical protein